MPIRFKLVGSLQFNVDQFEIRPGGSHCDVAIVAMDGNNRFIKVIGGKKGKFTEEGAKLMASDIVAYEQELITVGIPVPCDTEIRILFDDEKDDYKILHIAPYLGHDADYWLTKDLTTMREATESLVDVVRCALAQTITGTELRVGFDPKPANFARSRAGAKFCYIDTMPPRFRKGKRVLAEYPEPTTESGKELAYFRFFDQRGVLQVLFVQLCRIRPFQRPFFFKQIARLAEEFEVSDYFLDSPAAIFARDNPRRRLTIVDRLEAKDLYWLRDCACHLTWEHKMTAIQLEEFFLITHFKDGLPSSSLQEAKEALVQVIKS